MAVDVSAFRPRPRPSATATCCIVVCAAVCVLSIGLGVGLGLGLPSSRSSEAPASAAGSSHTPSATPPAVPPDASATPSASLSLSSASASTSASPTKSASASASVSVHALPTYAADMNDTVAVVWTMPAGLRSRYLCSSALAFDLGCNAWWRDDEAWTNYTATSTASWMATASALGQDGNGNGSSVAQRAVILYFPLFLADAVHGSGAGPRLEQVIYDVAAAGLRVLLLLGRPEYYGFGNNTDVGDVVHDATARARLLSYVDAVCRMPAVQQHVAGVSVYWVGAAWFCAVAPGCSVADITAHHTALRSTIRAATTGRGTLPFLAHVDGPFWEACAAAPCTGWNVSGYAPASLAVADGVLGESWVQGVLPLALRTLISQADWGAEQLLLVCDVPNCDLFPSIAPCATGALATDVTAWFNMVHGALGVRAGWGTWQWCDAGTQDVLGVTGGGASEAAGLYSNVFPNGSTLTRKGALFQQRAVVPSPSV